MASLRDAVKVYQDELRAGIAWIAFWREGRSWSSDYIYLEMDDTLTPEDRSRLREIQHTDPVAVVLNGYYCGYLGEDMNLNELRRSRSRKRGKPPTPQGFPFRKSPTGRGILTLMFLTGA